MRGRLLASTALATLAAGPALAASAVPVASWSGCYVGVHVGGAWTDAAWTPSPQVWQTASAGLDALGAIGGAQFGCAYQAQNLVGGVEGEAWGSGLTGSTTFADFEGVEILHTTGDLGADVALRAGYAFDRVLLFGKIGVAVAGARFTDAYKPDFEGSTRSVGGAATSAGLLVGLGVEYALDAHWSVRGEYDYVAYGRHDVAMSGDFPYSARIRDDLSLAKVGVDYRF